MNDVHKIDNPAPTTRQQKREAKTDRLLQLALDMVVEGGMDGLTMPGLAKRAGVAVGGLYRYFDGKSALIATLQVNAIRELDAWIAERATEAGVAGVRQSVLAMGTFCREHPTFYLLLEFSMTDPRVLLGDPEIEIVDAAVSPMLWRVCDLLESAVEEGTLVPGPPMQRTRALWGLTVGSLLARKTDSRMRNEAWKSDAVLVAGLDAMLRGWSKAPTN